MTEDLWPSVVVIRSEVGSQIPVNLVDQTAFQFPLGLVEIYMRDSICLTCNCHLRNSRISVSVVDTRQEHTFPSEF